MHTLEVRLLGKFLLQNSKAESYEFESHKAEELLCYLLLNRERPHPREALADLLWGKDDARTSKNYLRKALWQLQAALDHPTGAEEQRVLLVEPEWLQINPRCDVWCDVAEIEIAFKGVKGISGRNLSQAQAQTMESAVELYRGDLMEGYYQDWCLFERERLQYQFLTLLEKLMDFCEQSRAYESGLGYGERILRYDRAHERTHMRLMRLHYLAGDRTAALRQYEKCQAVLLEELDTAPGEAIRQLYEQIRKDDLDENVPMENEKASLTGGTALLKIHDDLGKFSDALSQLQNHLQKDMQVIEQVMRH